jgi:sarcosine oxidase subunit gamma
MPDAPVSVQVLVDRGHINLRGRTGDPAFLQAIETICAIALPGALAVTRKGNLYLYNLGPDEWSLVMPDDRVPGLLADLNAATQGMHVAINDLSGAFLSLVLRGDKVRELLAKGCTLDLHPEAFTSGASAQTGLAKAGVLLGLFDAEFHLIVRRSFADYLLQWLHKAGAEYSIEFG